jgi:hypothetical protein
MPIWWPHSLIDWYQIIYIRTSMCHIMAIFINTCKLVWIKVHVMKKCYMTNMVLQIFGPFCRFAGRFIITVWMTDLPYFLGKKFWMRKNRHFLNEKKQALSGILGPCHSLILIIICAIVMWCRVQGIWHSSSLKLSSFDVERWKCNKSANEKKRGGPGSGWYVIAPTHLNYISRHRIWLSDVNKFDHGV